MPQAIVSFVRGSGFVEIVSQSSICATRSLACVLCELHYSRAWHMQKEGIRNFRKELSFSIHVKTSAKFSTYLSDLIAKEKIFVYDNSPQCLGDLSSEYEVFKKKVRSNITHNRDIKNLKIQFPFVHFKRNNPIQNKYTLFEYMLETQLQFF